MGIIFATPLIVLCSATPLFLVKPTSQVKFRHSSSKLQLHSRTQKSCALFCHFMALILNPFSFQRNWKLFLNFQTDGVVTISDILTFFRSCTPGQLKLMSQVSKLVFTHNNVSATSESFDTLACSQEPHRWP